MALSTDENLYLFLSNQSELTHFLTLQNFTLNTQHYYKPWARLYQRSRTRARLYGLWRT